MRKARTRVVRSNWIWRAVVLVVVGAVATAANADEPRVVPLPSAASDAVLAGSGRVLLVPFARLRKIAVIDLETAKVARYLSINSDRFRVAGGATKIVVLLEDKRAFER